MYEVTIERRTSPYNKYIKWFASGISKETNARFSFGYKTLKEAIEKHSSKTEIIINIIK